MKNFVIAMCAAAALFSLPAAAQNRSGELDLAYRQRTEERLSALDSQVRDLTGLVERMQFRLRQADQRIEALERQLNDVQSARPPSAANIGTPPATDGAASPASQTLPTGEPQAEYDAAYGLLGQGQFAQGEAAFRTFLQRYPDHQLAPNARYWVGETLYARQKYQDAATAFLEAWQADVDGPKAADNLLKLGMSLSALDKKNEACVSFAKLLSDYRGAPARVRNAASRESKSIGCS